MPSFYHSFMGEAEDGNIRAEAHNVEIRRIRENDWEQYRYIRLKALESNPAAFSTTLDEALAFDDTKWIERSRKNSNSSTEGLWLGFLGVKPVGIVGMFMQNVVFNLCHLWVDPAVRHNGLGRRLVETAIAWVDSQDASAAIRLDVSPVQGSAFHLYLQCGFISTGVEVSLPHDQGTSLWEMILNR